MTDIAATLDGIAEPDPTRLLERWEGLLYEGNRRGVLAGTSGDGRLLARVTYRLGLRSAVPRVRTRGALRLTRRAVSSRDYRRASGPPLAPFGEASRTISNFATRAVQSGVEYYVECGWVDVLSRPTRKRAAEPFLRYHFRPVAGSWLPRRDLRGVRPQTAEQLRRALQRWLTTITRQGN